MKNYFYLFKKFNKCILIINNYNILDLIQVPKCIDSSKIITAWSIPSSAKLTVDKLFSTWKN